MTRVFPDPATDKSLPLLTLRTHVIICGALFAALIGIAILGNVLEGAGMAPLSGASRYVALMLFFGLFIAFGLRAAGPPQGGRPLWGMTPQASSGGTLSAIPVMVMLVLRAQVKAGNQDVPAIAAVIRRQNIIIWTLWGLIIAGLCVAIPAMIVGGAFE